MRVRIVRQPSGTVDGIDLWKFLDGNVYDVASSLGTFLIASRWAEPVLDDRPGLVVPIDHPEIQRVIEISEASLRHQADDRPTRKRR